MHQLMDRAKAKEATVGEAIAEVAAVEAQGASTGQSRSLTRRFSLFAELLVWLLEDAGSNSLLPS